jgi:uncharacterized damage-inducible protein DinB
MLEGLKQQYDWIRSVREVLFTFLEEIPLHTLHETVPGFGISTIIGAHMTHEFHHKGQIVSMARHLGFNPPADDRLGALFS